MTILALKSFLLLSNIYFFGNSGGLEHLVLMWAIFFFRLTTTKTVTTLPWWIL